MHAKRGGKLGRSVIVCSGLIAASLLGACVGYKMSEGPTDAGRPDGSVADVQVAETSTDGGVESSVVSCTVEPCVRQVAAGDFHTCALLMNGTLRCWGLNASGEIGQAISGYERKYSKPTEVPSLTGVTDVACGGISGFAHTCARTNDGKVLCWGQNSLYQLGRSGPVSSPDPTPSDGVRDAVDVSTCGAHVCAGVADGGVACWGANTNGQLGRTPVFDGGALLPGPVQSLPSAVLQARAGWTHTCVLLENRTVACFGQNANGELGVLDAGDQVQPRIVPDLANVAQLRSAGGFSCALSEDTGDVVCWGYNREGELGNGSMGDGDVPKRVLLPAGHRAVRFGGSAYSTCAVLDDDSVWCWGFNLYGQVGVPTGAGAAIATPLQVTGLRDGKVLEVVGGYAHTCALFDDGAVECWGSNAWGELGRGDVIPDGGLDNAAHPEPDLVAF